MKWLIKLDHTRTWCHLSFLTPSQRTWPLENRFWPRCIATDRNRPFSIPTSTELRRFPQVANKWTSRTYLSTSNKDTWCDRIALTTRFSYHRTSNTIQPSLLAPLAKRPKRRGEKGEETRLFFSGSLPQRHLVNLRSVFLQSNQGHVWTN